MAATPIRQWGVTPPIITALPTDAEIASNDALIAELKQQNNFESADETEKRKTTLALIQKVTVEFVRQVCKRNKELSAATVHAAGGKIFTFGSYRLGVYGPGSDIDTLVVVPRHVTRDHFFEYFPGILRNMTPPGAIEELTSVPDAYVPIIKMKLFGISIDLIFARLGISSVPLDLTLKDMNILRGLSEQDLRSVNGTRVTDEILDLVPQQKTFRTALRGIKLWAQRRAIYANVIGFPGGVAWAMLVARVCQLYPQATGAVVIGKFFHIIGQWTWPQPVLLKPIEDGPLKVRVWNPKVYNGDRFHLMPIITPAYPSMCATHNVSLSTKTVIVRELERGEDITHKIFTGQLQWKDLFAKHTFFTEDYKYYLSIVASSRSKEAQVIWSGLVESKVRLLVANLETQGSIEVARPFNKGFDRVHRCNDEDEVASVISGDLTFQAKDIKTETTDSVHDPKHIAAAEGGADNMTMPNDNGEIATDSPESVTIIYTTTYYVGIELVHDGTKSLNISYQTTEFKDLCQGWQNYNPEQNSLNIIHTRNYDLPADVFAPGEVKPKRSRKKAVTKLASNSSTPDSQNSKSSEQQRLKRSHESSLPQGHSGLRNEAKRQKSTDDTHKSV